ncbi:hypothetical protein [Ekhidna sp.]|uniref:hypothetical protein n=1 Tax=Ekhidna sp. TaxID=2608089 RepID=UPI0032976431
MIERHYVLLVITFAAMIKAIKVFNSISVLLFSVILLLVYAYLPIMVDLNVEGVKDLHKQTFFYYAFGSFVIVNLIVRIGVTLGSRKLPENLAAWIRAILFIINFYLASMIGFIGVINNTGHINPSSFGYLNFIGPIFLLVWGVGLIFFLFKKK